MPLESDFSTVPYLATLAESDRPMDRALWLKVATDYFLSPALHADNRSRAFERALAMSLSRATPSERLEVARRLATCPTAPRQALDCLEALGGEAAIHVLKHAVALPVVRVLVAATADTPRAAAVAERADLEPSTVELLARRTDVPCLLALARNPSAPISSSAFLRLARFADQEIEKRGDSRLAEALLERMPARPEQAALFLSATSRQRAAILAAAQRAELGQSAPGRRLGAPTDLIRQLEEHALERNSAQFVLTLAEAVGCDETLAGRIAHEASGEPLAVALAAIQAPDEVAVRILVSGDLQSGNQFGRIGSLSRLKGALNPAAARSVVSALVGSEPVTRRRAAPVLEPTAAPTPSRPTAPEAMKPRRLPLNAPLPETLSPPILRRRRALAFAAGRKFIGDRA